MPINIDAPDLEPDISRSDARQQESSAIRLFVIDAERPNREAVVARLAGRIELQVSGAPEDLENALRRVARARSPRVVLVHAAVMDDVGMRFVERMRQAAPEVRVIVFDVASGQRNIVEFVKAGASGFIMAGAGTPEVTQAIQSVAAGDVVLPVELAGTLLTQLATRASDRQTGFEAVRAERMTKREREVVDLLADGLSNREIGRRLNVGTPTVKSHVHSILDKLALRTRLEIASFGWDERETAKRRAGTV